jgi:hypothetical protein
MWNRVSKVTSTVFDTIVAPPTGLSIVAVIFRQMSDLLRPVKPFSFSGVRKNPLMIFVGLSLIAGLVLLLDSLRL